MLECTLDRACHKAAHLFAGTFQYPLENVHFGECCSCAGFLTGNVLLPVHIWVRYSVLNPRNLPYFVRMATTLPPLPVRTSYKYRP